MRWSTAARPNPPCGGQRADDDPSHFQLPASTLPNPKIRRRHPMTKSRWIIAGLIVAGVGFATFQGLRPRPPPPVEVTTSAAKKGAITRTVTAAGHLQAHETVKVSSNISGDLLSLAVKEGEQVRKGQVLGQIDRRLQESQVAQFRAGVANARASIDQINASIAQDRNDLRRTETLVKQNLASDSDLDKAQILVKVDEGRLAAQKRPGAQTPAQLETALYHRTG